MITFVDHRLGEIERGDTRTIQETVVEQRLVHAGARKRRAHHILERSKNVVGRKNGIFRRLADAIRTMAQHIGERPHKHAHLTVEGAHAAEGRTGFKIFTVFDVAETGIVVDQQRQWRERRQGL